MERAAIERAARLAGLELSPRTQVTVDGDDPIRDSPLHLAKGVATAIALVGQEVDRIWRLRGGRRQSLRIDAAHAVASLRSYEHVRLRGRPVPAGIVRPATTVSGFWRATGGRWIHLHDSFDDTAGILAELGLDGSCDRADVAAACATRDAFELEDALAAKGLCSAVVRSQEEWLAHPQGALMATKPVLEVRRIGPGPRTPFPDGDRPLSGIRVLDLTRVLAGPTCARTLAEHGADVLHVASPRLPTAPGFEIDTGYGKRQAHLDLDDPLHAATLRELIVGADVFSQGFRHRSLERRGFGEQHLAKLRPGIVYVSENAYGHEGPWATRPGWEQLAQSATGIAQLHDPEQPALAPAALNDYTTGYLAALGTLIALRRRALQGGSWQVRVSLTHTAMWYLRIGTDADRTAATGWGDVDRWCADMDTAMGPVRYLRPVLHMSETEPRWDLPAAPLGSHEPVWC